jgi:hypothetical protein
MQNVLTTIVVLVIATVLGALMLVLTTKVVNYSLEQEKKAADEATATIDSLVKLDHVALSDFIEKLGEPDNVTNVMCEQNRCIKARWDISTVYVRCWKRLQVILNEEQKTLFYSEVIALKEIKVKDGSVESEMCAEAPKS